MICIQSPRERQGKNQVEVTVRSEARKTKSSWQIEKQLGIGVTIKSAVFPSENVLAP